MPPMTRRLIAALSLSLVAAGCGEPEAAAEAPDPGKIETARLSVQAGEAQILAAEADLKLQEEANRATLERLAAECETAAIRLRQHGEIDSARRVEEAELSVRRAEDAVDDAKDELEQLEALYKGNELADATKEIILKRGRRNLERGRKEADLQKLKLRTLKEHDLPADLLKLQTEASQRKAELERETRSAANQMDQKRIAVLKARIDLAKAREELSDLEKPPPKSAPAGN